MSEPRNRPTIRTDLAIEQLDGTAPQRAGISQQHRRKAGLAIDLIDIESEQAAAELQKAVGRYITVESSGFSSPSPHWEEEVEVIAELLREMLPPSLQQTPERAVLVVGLGNQQITPDALGPLVVSHTLATRHIDPNLAKSMGLHRLQSVAALAPGVLGQTGIETAEVIGAVCRDIKPSLVIVIDALAAKSVSRLGNTIQMSNTGISPGSGVMNRRKELSAHTLGVPVISVGVPTVVDLASIVADFVPLETGAPADVTGMMVTPRDIDVLMEHASKTIAFAIGRAVQPNLSLEDLVALSA